MDPIDWGQLWATIQAVMWMILGLLSAILAFLSTMIETSRLAAPSNTKVEDFADAEDQIEANVVPQAPPDMPTPEPIRP